ncbi:MAG: transposase [Candidatus Cloacimonetes bacterium]|nr:transposase [Candidatus Cloacimonadota bacterium]
MKSRYKVVDPEGIHFVTSTIIEWIPIFIQEEALNIIINSLTFCQKEKGLKIYAYVIIPEHLHLIISSTNIVEIMQSFKRHTAKTIIELLTNTKKEWILNQFHYFKKKNKIESEFQVWQEGFHPQLLNSFDLINQKMQYIHQNPVRKGFVNDPEYWRYSSACNLDFEGNKMIKLDKLEFR